MSLFLQIVTAIGALAGLVGIPLTFFLTRRKYSADINLTDANTESKKQETYLKYVEKIDELIEDVKKEGLEYLSLNNQFLELNRKFNEVNDSHNRLCINLKTLQNDIFITFKNDKRAFRINLRLNSLIQDYCAISNQILTKPSE